MYAYVRIYWFSANLMSLNVWLQVFRRWCSLALQVGASDEICPQRGVECVGMTIASAAPRRWRRYQQGRRTLGMAIGKACGVDPLRKHTLRFFAD